LVVAKALFLPVHFVVFFASPIVSAEVPDCSAGG